MVKAVAALLAAGVPALLLIHGTGESGVREVVRWTARCSVCLLSLALVADGLRGGFFGWRRFADVLRSLALSHSVHALAVAALAFHLGGRNLLERSSPIDVLGGALAYVFIFWGALRPHSRATSAGLFWIWGVFMVSYGVRALRSPLPFAFPVAMLVLAMLVRLGFHPGSASPSHA
jgi:hypothetical protein